MESLVQASSGKKNIIIKTWERCRSIPSSSKKKAPKGFFPVYVGPDRLWFAMKMKYANHPLFQVLLEDTEIEYGYNTPGPILLPCELDHFYEVLAEMEARNLEPRGCGLGY
ncbi:small auxin-up RNA [Artemisia annua]|uniref:Small auxin-up RNA n=1 Tax=Artemisia annua TaxID=35608 RepID=A0A2U1M6H3_ARTAN|nr:small auxin-up RNA [Artemisia annua]